MAYRILVQTFTDYRQIEPSFTWSLECYEPSCRENMYVIRLGNSWDNMPLVMVLCKLETNAEWKLVGNDGPNRFILYRND